MTEATPQTAVASAGTAPVKATVSEGTEYVILERSGTTWSQVANVTARTAVLAIREAIAGDMSGGTFVAIPERSWKPVMVTPETVTTLKLEEAK